MNAKFCQSWFWRRVVSRLAVFLFIPLLARCASYAGRIEEPRRFLESGQYDAAIVKLKEYAAKEDKDELLYLMDLGMAYHRAARYAEAVETFLKADKIAEIKDYTSLTQEAGSVLLNDDVKPYKGEDFEKILINVYLAIDYTLMHKWEDALVEARRVNHKLDLMIAKAGLHYQQNAFAKYLSAMLFEGRREYNDALVDYRTVEKWIGSYPYLPPPLLRLTSNLRMDQEFDEYSKKYPQTDYKIGKNEGEVVLILEQGRAPIKVESHEFRLVPRFRRRGYASEYVTLRDADGKRRARSYPLFDIESTAIKELDDRIAGMVAKKVGGFVVKELVADQIAKQTKSPELGALASLLMHATDHADTRSWSTLPAKLHVARLVLPVGKQTVALDMKSVVGAELKGVMQWTLDIKPRETVFVTWRTQE